MVEMGCGHAFPVTFYDGDRVIDLGDVRVPPSLDFKSFQSIICQRIGVSPSGVTIYLVDGTRPRSDDRRKILLTGMASFAVVGRQKGCSFLVVLKRHKKRDPTKRLGLQFSPENILLRPEQVYCNPIYPAVYVEYGDWKPQDLRVEKGNYVKRVSNSANHAENLGLDSFPRVQDCFATTRRLLCGKCMAATSRGKAAPFHHCVHDPIIRGFRSAAGPVAQPVYTYM